MDGYAVRAEDTVGASEVAPVRFMVIDAEEQGSGGAGEKEAPADDSFPPAPLLPRSPALLSSPAQAPAYRRLTGRLLPGPVDMPRDSPGPARSRGCDGYRRLRCGWA
jgi:hypothetical protein